MSGSMFCAPPFQRTEYRMSSVRKVSDYWAHTPDSFAFLHVRSNTMNRRSENFILRIESTDSPWNGGCVTFRCYSFLLLSNKFKKMSFSSNAVPTRAMLLVSTHAGRFWARCWTKRDNLTLQVMGWVWGWHLHPIKTGLSAKPGNEEALGWKGLKCHSSSSSSNSRSSRSFRT